MGQAGRGKGFFPPAFTPPCLEAWLAIDGSDASADQSPHHILLLVIFTPLSAFLSSCKCKNSLRNNQNWEIRCLKLFDDLLMLLLEAFFPEEVKHWSMI